MRFFLSTLLLTTILAAPAFAAPTAAQILAANKQASGGGAWDNKVTLDEKLALTGQGLTGTADGPTDLRDGRYVTNFTLGPASGAQGYDGTTAWDKDPSGTVKADKGGDAIPLAVNSAYRNANLWWKPNFGGATVKVDGEKTADGMTAEVLTVTPKGGKPFDAWFDARTHLLDRIVEVQGPQTVTTTFSDYRDYDGVKLPVKTVVDSGMGAKYLQTVTIAKVDFLPEQPASAYAMPKVSLNDYTIAGGAHRVEAPFQLLNNHIYADVSVNGKGPLLFIFDTGGQNILTPDTAKALGVKVQGAMPGGGVGDKAADFGLTKIETLSIGNATFKNQIFGVLNFEPNAVEGVDIKGMIGFAVFKRFVTRIDYSGHKLTLIDPKYFNPADAGTPVKFVFNGDIPEVTGSFEGIPAKFDIDTGARDELTLTGPFAEKNNLRSKHPKGVDAVDGWGVGGSARGYVTRGGELDIGGVKIPHVVTSLSLQKKGAFSDASYQGNIGGGVLKRFIVTFDYANQTLYLKPQPVPVADIGTFDRSGMWINATPEGYKILDVTKTGAAHAAGLKVGDIITAVDGKPATATPVYATRQRLRDEPAGTVVSLTVKGPNGARTVPITLKDQI